MRGENASGLRLAGLLATLPDVEITGTAEEALTALEQNPPDVVFMDINLPGTSGAETTRRAAQIAPSPAVLIVSMVDDSVIAAITAGARGHILKGATAGEITVALRTVAAGGAVSAPPSPTGCSPGRLRTCAAQPPHPPKS